MYAKGLQNVFPRNTPQAGDRLAVSQYQSPGTRAGAAVNFTDGTYSAILSLPDQNGHAMNSDTVSGQWRHRVIDLSSQAGKTILYTYFLTEGDTAPGHWSVDYRDFVYLHADGTVTKLYDGEDPSGQFLYSTPGQSNVVQQARTGGPYPGNAPPQTYFLADHLGTTQMELSAGGWPVWQGQFAPFGQELDNQNTTMRFKFTGKERDAESGLDYFGARYYASSIGRWMSPDWADKPEAVPYSD